MGIARQLSQIDIAMEVITSFPELRTKPIIIGESDPEGAAAAQGPQLGYRYVKRVVMINIRLITVQERHNVFVIHSG